ncbi:hypothetical protein [Paenibacillus sp. FSL R10-2734]|uniref:hypothetical protein n=1 Tax=Paenibacillus sp. FSL R10-2734 TaxID=2954691 RepID=UPI0030D77416
MNVRSYGFESMPVTIEPACMVLNPGESRAIALTVQLNYGIAPGGYEEIVLRAI